MLSLIGIVLATAVVGPALLQREARAARTLADEASERAQLWQDRASAQEDAHARFMRELDHELKNPLQAIKAAFADLEETDGLTESIQTARGQVDRLRTLSARLRQIASVTSERIAPEPVDLNELVQDAVELARAAVPGSADRVHLVVQQIPWRPAPVQADRELLSHAIYNLLDNALKYSPEEQLVEVRLREDGTTASIEVADAGCGIDPDDLSSREIRGYAGAQDHATPSRTAATDHESGGVQRIALDCPLSPGERQRVLSAELIPFVGQTVAHLRADDYGRCIAAEVLRIPHASVRAGRISSSYAHRHAAAEQLVRLRSERGLPPDPDMRMLHRYLYLACEPPGFHDADEPQAPTMHRLRPVVEAPGSDGGAPAWLADLPMQTAVYATLGTMISSSPDGAASAFEMILEGLRDEQLNVILTVGRTNDPAQFGPQPSHVRYKARRTYASSSLPHSSTRSPAVTNYTRRSLASTLIVRREP